MSLHAGFELAISAPRTSLLASPLPSDPASDRRQLRPALSGHSNCSAHISPIPSLLSDTQNISSNTSVLADTSFSATGSEQSGEPIETLDSGRYALGAPRLGQQHPESGLFASGIRSRSALGPPVLDGVIEPRADPLAEGRSVTSVEKSAGRTLGSPAKKSRLLAPGYISLPPAANTPNQLASIQPLVGSPRLAMVRPAHFSTSEMGASIMPDSENPDGVTTVHLPKGHVSAASPSMSSSTPRSWSSAELSGLSRSPDGWPQPSALQLLQGIGILELLEQDERPTFIIDLNDQANFGPGPLHVIFANAALRTTPGLLASLQQPDAAEAENSSSELASFKAWAASLARDMTGSNPSLPSVTYAGFPWTCSTLRRRFRVIRGYNMAASAPTSRSPPPQTLPLPDSRFKGFWTSREAETTRERSDYFGTAGAAQVWSHSESRSGAHSAAETVIQPFDDLALHTPDFKTTFDWTRIPIDDPNLPAHYRFARSIDWASTPLGPVELWRPELRILSSMIMGSPHPAALYWGPEHVAIYNEAYISLAGQKHPELMGSRCRDAWPEIWDRIEPAFDGAWNRACATMKNDDALFIDRHGFVEETFFNWAVIPLVGADGSVVALYHPAFENTRRRINERRMLTLREIGIKTSQARDVKSFWGELRKGLEYNELDVPFALIYSVGEDSESEVSSMNSGSLTNPPQIVLEASVGVPEDHPCAIPFIDLRTSDRGFAPYMRESMAHPASHVVLSEEDGTLPPELVQGLSERGFREQCRTVVIFPVHPTPAGDTVVGFIVLGINPRRQYDGDYQLFVSLLSRQLATSLASVVLFEEEIRRGQRAARLAALDRQELSMQLHLRTREAVESEYRFTRMAEFGPVGLFIADGQGRINYCNEMWHKISGLERSTATFAAWMQSIREEDRPGTEDAWRRLVEEKTAVTHEFRFKASRQLMDGHSVDVWALMSAYPEKDDDGELKSIFGCITDISQLKWAEYFQKQRRDEAVELKRQQENFIDITSHEMRNPLSAILQCADEISSGLSQYKRERLVAQAPGALGQLIDSCVEAASTISLCANHQKRIVDDILTLSKLDSNLLLVTPVDVQPVKVVQNVLKMFETELASNDIEGKFCVDQTYHDLAIDWVKLDPSRLRQVLINLITNAIKFTQGRPKRSIVIRLGASKDFVEDGLSYVPPQNPNQQDLTDDADWDNGEKIHLHLAVTDTGPGLDTEEKKILFQRFSQASPRTHVKYGGSGLGLFICRILTELQGGRIGVHSEKGQGSTFAFYIKGRKSAHRPAESPGEPVSPITNPLPPSPSPVASAPQQHDQVFSGVAEPTPEPPVKEPSPSPPILLHEPRSLDVLIVEDNLVNQRVLKRQLQLSGNNTYVANHGVEALSVLRRSRFWNEHAAARNPPDWLPTAEAGIDDGGGGSSDKDEDGNGDKNPKNVSVILMDLEMPVMDGISCAREIRRLEAEGVITQHIPIIAVTAYARPEQVVNAKAAGVDDVISKPFRIPELIPKIEELVAKHGTAPWF
ncbi:hypothetical protein VTK26DRAFT_6318 [Humicola hyalothermophila]